MHRTWLVPCRPGSRRWRPRLHTTGYRALPVKPASPTQAERSRVFGLAPSGRSLHRRSPALCRADAVPLSGPAHEATRSLGQVPRPTRLPSTTNGRVRRQQGQAANLCLLPATGTRRAHVRRAPLKTPRVAARAAPPTWGWYITREDVDQLAALRVPNFTTPSVRANRVSSPPRPTLIPGWKWVPRWRTMIDGGRHRRAVEDLHPEALGVRVPAVAGRAATFGLGHRASSGCQPAAMEVISTVA